MPRELERGELDQEPVLPASLDTSFEASIDDAPDGVAGLVHSGPGLPMPAEPGQRLPVISDRLRTIAGVRADLARVACA